MEPAVLLGEQVVDAEYTPVVREDTAPVLHQAGVFAVAEPAAMIEHATKVADALIDVVRKRGLSRKIGTKEYLEVEAWTTLGVLVGCTARTEWTRPVDDAEGNRLGWEAAVEVVNANGVVIARAEAECLRSEKNWSNRDDFALKSMAQTRCMGKALRMPLGWIAVLAGYAATPEAEMPREASQSAPNPQPAAKATPEPTEEAKPTGEPRKASDRQIVMLHVQLGKCYDRELFTEAAYRAQLKKDYGVESSKQLTARECSQLIDRLAIVLGEQQSPA